MSIEHLQIIAKNIREQLKNGTDEEGLNLGVKCMGCWGFNSPLFLYAEKNDCGYQEGGLTFLVEGRCFVGRVFIRLMDNDTYTVQFQDNNSNIVQTYNDLYDEKLTPVIDSFVERQHLV